MCLCSVVVQYFFAECLCRRIVHCDCAVLLRRCLLMYVWWAGPHPPHLIPAQAHFQCPSFLCVVPVRCGCALPQRVAGCNSPVLFAFICVRVLIYTSPALLGTARRGAGQDETLHRISSACLSPETLDFLFELMERFRIVLSFCFFGACVM